MTDRDGGGKAGVECSMSCCIRSVERVGGWWCRLVRHGFRGISEWPCIGGWLVGG